MYASLADFSRVLFDMDGVKRETRTVPADASGAGVAAILRAHMHASHEKELHNEISRGNFASHTKDLVYQGHVPFVPPDRGHLTQAATKLSWPLVGNRRVLSLVARLNAGSSTLCYFDSQRWPKAMGYVALTIDDAPARLGGSNSKLREVRELLSKHKATATFMVMGRYVEDCESDLVALLQDGHEFGNHGLIDRPYHTDSKEDLDKAIDTCSEKIKRMQRTAGQKQQVRWFRAPWAKTSAVMHESLKERNLTHVLCDAYACCPVIQDGKFVGDYLSRSVSDGSVVVIHMPELGHREWCMDGLEVFLRGIAARNLQAVSLGNLADTVGWEQPQ